VYQKIAKSVKRLHIVSDKTLYIVLRGRWCVVILNVGAQTEDRSDDSKENFNEEFYHFPKNQNKFFFYEI